MSAIKWKNLFNAYSSLIPCEVQLAFNLNNSDGTFLVDIESNALTESIVDKVKFIGPVQIKPFTTRSGKSRTDRMRECFISDGTTL